MPGISERSKTIKKRKKAVVNVIEEGEEGAEVSTPLSDNEMTVDEDKAPNALLEQYDKFPEYITLTLKQRQESFAFTSYNKFAITEVLDQKQKEVIMLNTYPITLKIYLVPKLNILTIAKDERSDAMTTTIDDLLSNLIDFNDDGTNLQIKESQQIVSKSNDRVYKWLHTFAGLHVCTI
jgi:hypothetical protein